MNGKPPRAPTDDAGADDGEPQRARRAALEPASIVVRVGPKSTAVVRTEGERAVAVRIVSHGAVQLAAGQAEAASASGKAAARVVRAVARQVAERARLEILRGLRCRVVGTSGMAYAVIRLGSSGGSRATVEQVQAATDSLAVAWVDGHKGRQEPTWVEAMMIGSAVLAAILECLGVTEIEAEMDSPGEMTPDGY